MPRRFSDLRVVAAVPGVGWFAGVDRAFADAVIPAFEQLGVAVRTISLDEWHDPKLRETAISSLQSFEPHFAVSLPNGAYGLLFRDRGTNLFKDLLGVPLVLPWDHLLTQAPAHVLDQRQLEQIPPRAGALRDLRSALEGPLLRQYVSDSGHRDVYESLGILSVGSTRRYMPAAHSHFVKAGLQRTSPSVRGRIGFAGNIYTARGAQLQILNHPLLRQIDDIVRAAKKQNWKISGWHLLCQALDRVPQSMRESLGLTPDYALFWRIALDLLSYRVNTEFRLAVLNAITQPIDFFGNFADPDSSSELEKSGHIRYCDAADFRTELPKVFASYELWVDATNAPFINGCGSKVFDCFAAGSFMLIDYREDVLTEIGDIALSFMYGSAEELRDKVGFYQTHPEKRREIIEQMQAIITERLTREHFYERVCADMSAELGVKDALSSAAPATDKI